MFLVELELDLPQDYFLPADEICAEVWTNIIHRDNPDGPEVWSAVPMKLSHVIPGQGIAVFSAHIQPTGRGDFGLTARWKSRRDLYEWEWAPLAPPPDAADGEESMLKDVAVSVKVPRSLSGTSSWTIGPQSVMIWAEDGPRVNGSAIGGPGLYLGNHAAATRAKINGYEAVLSLVGDLQDFDENIPESDKDLNKKIWDEQAKTGQYMPYSPLSGSQSRSPPSSSRHHSNGGGGGPGGWSHSESANRNSAASKRLSVIEFMESNDPDGTRWDPEKISAAVVDEPEEPPRVARRSSVTDMMVQPPSAPSRRSTNRSTGSIAPIDEYDQQNPKQGTAPALAATTEEAAPAPALAPNRSHSRPSSETAPASKAPKTPSIDTTKNAAPAAATSGKMKKGMTYAAIAATPPAASKDSEQKITGSTLLATPGLATPMISSLDIASAPDVLGDDAHPSSSHTGSASQKDEEFESPPSSARVVSGLSSLFLGSSPTPLGSTSNNPFADDPRTTQRSESLVQPKRSFQHKVISLAPGAHSIISDANLKEAVDFLRTQVGEGKKVLVHCRDGNGRSGSVAVAFVASQLDKNDQPDDGTGHNDHDGHKSSHYDESLQEVWKWKCDVYPHKGLKQSLERIVW